MASTVLLLSLALYANVYVSAESPTDSNEAHDSIEENKTEPKVRFGYRLPGNLFNDGKPFYVEKDPVTGQFDFETKTSPSYEASKDKPQQSLSDAPVERTDTETNDVTFYDFLNLPVKYTSSKYVYPLISSSYANTKHQGNRQSSSSNINNHKLDVATEKVITQRPNYYNHKIPSTTENFYENFVDTTTQNYLKNVVTTTPKPTTKLSTTAAPTMRTTIKPKTTTTERTMSLFEQLFGSYDDMTTDKYEEDYSDNDLVPSDSKHEDHTSSTTAAPLKTTTEIISTKASTTLRTTSPTSTLTTTQPTTTTTMRTTTSTKPALSVQPISTISSKTENLSPLMTLPTTSKPTPVNQYRISSTARPFEVNSPALITHKPPSVRPISQENFISTSLPTTTQRPTYLPSTERPQSQPHPHSHSHPYLHPQLPSLSYQLVTSMPLGEFDMRDVQPTKPQIMYEQPPSNDQYVQMSVQMGNNQILPPNSHNSHSFASNNIIVPAGENSVSFVVHNQQAVDGGQYIGSTAKENYPNAPNSPQQENYPNRPSQLVSENYPKRPNQPLPENYPNRPNQPQQENYPNRPYQPQQENYPNRPSQPISENYPNRLNQPLPENYPNRLNQLQQENYPNIPNQPQHMQLHGEMIVSPQQDVIKVPLTTSTSIVREGQVFPAKPESDNEIQSKVVFPKPSTNLVRDQSPVPTKQIPIVNDDIDLVPPPPSEPLYAQQNSGHGNQKEILQLIGQPLYHQIPKDITSSEKLHRRPDSVGHFRPPWDPRPGHFQMGKPEFSRPLRTNGPPSISSRISEAYPLPNILPQFRPNSRTSYVDYWEDRHPGQHVHYPPRQPLGHPSRPYHEFYDKTIRQPYEQIERGPNKRIGRPEISMSLYDLPKSNYPEVNRRHSTYRHDDGPSKFRGPHPYFYERIYEAPVPKPSMELKEPLSDSADEYAILKAPPVVPISLPRQEENTPETVVTLQMIQSKQMAKEIGDGSKKSDYSSKFTGDTKISPEDKRQVYVVYPVNSTPIKLAAKQQNNKVGMIIATHGTMKPVVSSEISKEDYTNTPFTLTHEKQKPLLIVRQKGEMQKVANKIKSSFPYPLENPEVDPVASEIVLPTEQNTLFTSNQIIPKDEKDNDVWNSGNNPPKHIRDPLREADRFDLLPPDESSEKPIAIAYTATGRPELKATLSADHNINKVSYPGPNFGNVDNTGGSEFTVSAVMHTLSRAPQQGTVLDVAPDQEFHAPFQASENLGTKPAEGWKAVGKHKPDADASNNDKERQDKEEHEDEEEEKNTTDTQFAFEHFKPQLFGGFKPIYKLPTPNQNLNEEITTQNNGRLERSAV